jgi:hypothetical protein
LFILLKNKTENIKIAVLIELIIKSVGKEMRRNRKGKNDLFSF